MRGKSKEDKILYYGQIIFPVAIRGGKRWIAVIQWDTGREETASGQEIYRSREFAVKAARARIDGRPGCLGGIESEVMKIVNARRRQEK